MTQVKPNALELFGSLEMTKLCDPFREGIIRIYLNDANCFFMEYENYFSSGFNCS